MPISQTGARMDTEADDYLNEWREVPLTSVADIRFSSVNKVSQPGEEPVRLCNYTDVYNNDYVTADMDFMRATATKSEIERFGLQVGDVIITKDSETPDDIGIPTVVDTTAPDLVCGYHLALLRPKQDGVDPTFLAKQLAHHRIARYFGQQANGTTRYGLSTAAISNAPLHLPRPENQRSASALMRMVDVQIAQTESVIAKLKQVRAGMLHDLLSYGLDEHGQLRDPVAHPEQFKDSPLGLIPREWDVCTLDSLGRWAGGKTPSKANSEFWAPGLTLWVTPKDVKDTEVVNTEDRLSRIGSSIMEIFPAGSLLVVGRSGILRHTLPVAIAKSPFTINQDLKVLAPNRQDDEPIAKFLLLVLLSRDQDILRRCVKVGTTVESIDWKDFKNLLIGWPSKSERVRICNHIETFDRKLSLFSCELKKLTYFKYGLQDDLLIGRVRVPETIMEGAENA